MAEKTNGMLVRWVALALSAAVIYTALVIYVASVSAKAEAAHRTADENHSDMKGIVDAMHRVEKRQVMIMTKLGVKEKKR